MMGPYGTCKIAGLTPEQANNQIEKQLSSYMKQPRVALGGVTPVAPAPTEVVWKKANNPPPLMLAQHTTQQPIRPVGFQAAPANAPTPPPTEAGPVPIPVAHPGLPVKHGMPHGPSELHPVLLPSYVIRPPDVLWIDSQRGLLTESPKGPVRKQPLTGQHLVRPDGTVGLGIYGSAIVAGKTVEEARETIARLIHARLDATKVKLEDVIDGLSVDVLAFNSSVYYVITDGAGQGEQVFRFPVTGNETVLDAISLINGLPLVSSPRRIWVARKNAGHPADSIYPVDWKGISQMGAMNTNWQLMPGDRLYVQADPVRRFSNNLGKYLEPVERLFGATLLGSQTINSIKSGSVGR
jgi:polysaccharide export outer membrane protein